MTKTKQSLVIKALLTAGAVAGPLYVIVGLCEMMLRDGFDIRRHSLSLMSNGEWGWVHIALLIVSGLLTIAAAIGIRRILKGTPGGTWAPILLIVYGLGLLAAGVFVADPMDGFPAGTSAGMPETVTLSGILHLALGSIGFLGLISACMVFARRFKKLGQKSWAMLSFITGIVYFAAFFGIAMGSRQGPDTVAFVNIAFSLAVVLGWTWLSAVCLKLKKENI